MAGPFYNAIKGTTAGTPGTGAFTPNAASSGFLAWSTVPTGWIGLVRYEDGTDWELQYSYWDGTTLSRAATTQFVSSSTGSALTLTSAATAALVMDGNEIQSHLGSVMPRFVSALVNSTTLNATGLAAPTNTGTAGAAALASTNYLTEQPRIQLTSATTANAAAGWGGAAFGSLSGRGSTTAGRGGFEYAARFGCSQLPTGPRLAVGMGSMSTSGEPSQNSHLAAFGKDSTDTNIQFWTNGAGFVSTKQDTGITLVANGWYEACVWMNPGSMTTYGLLCRLDTGAIWYGSQSTNLPASGQTLSPQLWSGLNGTNTGTAVVLHIGHLVLRLGS